jgi:murein L,D-transpeptidase YcbB/YkuD
MNGDASVRVELKETIPVLIVYGTAIVLQNGEVHFFHDVYGRDAALEQALRARHADHRQLETPGRLGVLEHCNRTPALRAYDGTS